MFKRQVKFKIFFYLTVEGGGWGTEGKGIDMSTMQKGAIFGKSPHTFVPHCRFTCMCTYH